MKYFQVVSICLVVLTGLATAQTVYKSTDAQGNPVFTDQPKPGAKAVELQPVNTAPAAMPSTRPVPQGPAATAYAQIGINVPSPIPNGLTPTTIGIIIVPALQPGDSWQLKLDGSVIASGVESSTTISKFERGDHTLQVDVLRGGSIVGSSSPTDVFVFWPGGAGSPGSGSGPKPTPH